jgi:hypothetical protein
MFQVPLLLYTVLKIDGERDVLNGGMDDELCHKASTIVIYSLIGSPYLQALTSFIIFRSRS